MRLVNWRTLAVAAAGFGLAACGDDVSITPPTLVVTPSSPSVSCTTGGTVAAGVSVAGGSGTSTVTFTGGNGITVTGTGTSVSIVCGNTPGASSVTYTVVNGNQTVTGSIPVTINAAQAAILAVTINPQTVTVPVGGTATVVGQVQLAPTAPSGTVTTVSYSSADTSIATVNATTGVITGKKAGQTTIKATSTAATNLSASAVVTVTGTSALVSALNVSPSNITTTVGGTTQLTTNVTLQPTAPAGTSTGVICRSSATAVATVSSGCLVTGVTAGSSTITVLAAADTNVRTTVGVTVGAPAPVRLTIQNFRVISTVNGNQVPADLNNVAGNLYATLNLDPGDFRPDSVRVRLGSQAIVCQRFSAQLAQAFRDAIQTGAADVQPIECQLNTAQFDTLTGTPSVLNGQQTLTAEVFYRPQGGGASTTQSATINQVVTLNNQSGYYVAVTNTPSATQLANGAPANGQATGPQGVLWRAGTVNVSVLPVAFVAGTPNSPLSLTVSLADNNGGGAGFANVIATKTATVNGGAAATVSFTGTTGAYNPAPAGNNVTGYSSPLAGTATGGTQVQIGGGANAVVLNQAGAAGAAPVIYIDNAAPFARAQSVSTNFLIGATNTGFINGTFAFADSVQQASTTTCLGGTASLCDYNGVDRVARSFFFATNSAQTPAQIISGGTAVTTGSQIAQSTDATAYVAAAKLVDALGNAAAVPVNAAATGNIFTFGVITATPTVTVGGAANLAQVGAGAAASAASVSFTATSTAGASFPQNYIVGTVTLTRPNGSQFCALTSDVSGTGAVTQVTTVAGAAAPCDPIAFNQVTLDPTTAAEGVYTITGQARDIAGNLSASFTRTILIDRTAPGILNPTVVSAPLTGGASETFSAQATDNFGLVNQLALNQYAVNVPATNNAGAELLLRYDGAALGAAFATPFTTTANLSITEPSFIRAVTSETPAGGAYTAVNGQTFTTINNIALGATDQGNNATYAPFAAGVITGLLDNSPAQTAVPVIFGGASGPVSASVNYQASTSSCTASPAGTQCPATFATVLRSATSGAPTAVTVNFVLNGTGNTPFASPFTKVELYRQVTLPGATPFTSTVAYQLVGSFGGQSISIGTTTTAPLTPFSTITQSFTIRPGTTGLPGYASTGTTAQDFLVVAQTANGYAVVFALPAINFGT